jgi:hypothetical protein
MISRESALKITRLAVTYPVYDRFAGRLFNALGGPGLQGGAT